MITIPTPSSNSFLDFVGCRGDGVDLWIGAPELNTRTLDFSPSSGPHTHQCARGPSYQEEDRHKSLVERRNHGVDLGADLDAVHEARGQLRSERRRARLGT